MIRRILSISGKPGLYRLVSQGKNMLIVESLADKRRQPIYANDKVVSLGDISIYTTEGDKPLAEVFESVKAKADGKPVDIKAFSNDQAIRDYFREILPDFDDDRVYTSDIKKLLTWYNTLIAKGITEFVEKATEENKSEEAKTEGE